MARKRRNHFIPRMLLKRFASKVSNDGEKHFVWRYERGENAREISTKDAGVAKDFYGKDDDVLENSFVALEGAHSSALKEIDLGSFSFATRSALLADMVWLLAMRTQANRGMMIDSVNLAMRETAKQLPSSRGRRFLKRNLERAWTEHFATLPEHQRYFLSLPEAQQALTAAKKQFFQDSSEIFGNFVEGFLTNPETSTLMGESHNEGLSKLIAAGARCPDAKAPTSWTLKIDPASQLVLGDACVFGRSASGDIVSFVGSDVAVQLYFPISPSSVLIGHFGEPRATLEPTEVRAASIAFSTKYVFSNGYNGELENSVQKTIGSSAHMIQPGQEKALVSSLWKSAKRS